MKHEASISTHIQPHLWEEANRRLTAKMLQEFMYEDMIQPEAGEGHWRKLSTETSTYWFQAVPRLFDSYTVKPDSLYKEPAAEPVRAVSFLLELQQMLPMSSTTVGHLIKEYQHTLLADCHLLARPVTAETTANMDYSDLEGEMTGHPWITYNKGRIGFNYEDYLQYAPEQKQTVRLHWIAVKSDLAHVQQLEHIQTPSFLEEECGAAKWREFEHKLRSYELTPADYVFLPVHPWQWENVLITAFAEEIATRRIVPLGDGEDLYLPQQSVRTFVNQTDKEKYHVKLPMSILNTLVYRGLPGERTRIAPEVTAFIKNIWEKDEFLHTTCGLYLLGEEVSIHVDNPAYESVEGIPYQYKEMLGAIWRESIYKALEPGEQAVTLASLLHRDSSGTSLVSVWMKQSGLNAEEWTAALHQAVLPPLLHYLYQYGTVFSPHGQNTIVVLENGRPKRLIMKDFVDDVNISDQPLPELTSISTRMKTVLRSEPPEGLVQFVFTGLFICHYRYLAELLEEDDLLGETAFWSAVKTVIVDYQKRFPELQERFELFDLLQPELTKLCLNRNRMIDYGYEDSDDRPHASEYGKVHNALADVPVLY